MSTLQTQKITDGTYDINCNDLSSTTAIAWVNFSTYPTNLVIKSSFNVSAVTWLGFGKAQITMTEPAKNINYAPVVSYTFIAGGQLNYFSTPEVLQSYNTLSSSFTTTSFSIAAYYWHNFFVASTTPIDCYVLVAGQR